MSIHDLITLANNRLSYIQQQKQMAEAQGDIAQLQKLTADEVETQAALNGLMTLKG